MKKFNYRSLVSLILIIAIQTLGSAEEKPPEFSDQQLEYFEQKVRPLLAKRCYECHSAKSKSLKGGLRLDSRKLAIKGGDTGPAIVPGNAKKSLLVDAINYGDLYQMPPKTRMPKTEVAVLTKWIDDGAAWPDEEAVAVNNTESFDLQSRKSSHWCWNRPAKTPLPNTRNTEWAQAPLDYYILAKLEDRNLSPNPKADRPTLIRRAYFDLIGLPPSPAEVNAFVNDPSKNAFEKVIDNLLDSPHFGERWARHWMDLVRYAESHGHEFDYPIRHATQYRDYLIRAFNADVPYNQFVIEHIAGDRIKQPRRHPELKYNESIIGTGFWFLGEATHAPVDVRADEAGRIDNQIDVMSKTFLALTVACARCHDHKFDAISTKDYYSLAGFLQSSRKHEALLDNNHQIANSVEKLKKLHGRVSKDLQAAASKLTEKQVTQLMLAAREVLVGVPKPTDKPITTIPDLIFEDFEGPSYDGWIAKGNAFDDKPQTQQTIANYQGNVKANGSGFVNTHNVRQGGKTIHSDNLKGTLTSRTFKVTHRAITFLVGGGNHRDRTCVNLLVNGKRVRTQTGFASNEMRPASFDVAEFIGQDAKIQIVDQQTGGWGNIGADHFVFTNNINNAAKFNRPVSTVAKEFGVDPTRLSKVVAAMQNKSTESVSHPLFAGKVLLAKDVDFGRVRDASRKSLKSASERRTEYEKNNQRVGKNVTDWFPEYGFEFASPAGTLDLSGTSPRMVPVGMAHSGHVSNRLRGVLRSPTFKLGQRNIHLRVQGDGVKSRLYLDGYYMYEFNGLLFGGFQFDVKNQRDQFQWKSNGGDVHRYLGHKGYIELTDSGDGFGVLDEVWISSGGPPPDRPSKLAEQVLENDHSNASDIARAYAQHLAKALAKWQQRQLDRDSSELLDWAMQAGIVAVDNATWSRFKDQHAAIERGIPNPSVALAITDGTPENEHVFIRGNHKTLGEEAPRRFLTAIDGDVEELSKTTSGRMELAKRITDPKNPLTTRVITNRLWHHLFGRGIVPSVDNFGVLGQKPSHPELLDHLALTFVSDDGWSIKSFLKRVMLSSTYQMSSTPSKKSTAIDPDNRLLHRMNIKRLQGEAIRDAILANSGRLDRKMFGGSVGVYLTPFMTGRGRPGSGPLDGAGRRSIYISVRRNFLSPMMLAFDTPIPFNSVGRRNVSNVPSQALILMNDPFVIEQSKVWARRILKDNSKTPTERIQSMYMTAFGKPATAQELEDANGFLRVQQAEYQIPQDRLMSDERLWADLGHVLWNTKPFIYLY